MADGWGRFSGKTILIAPLDWGLGHASRCVPLIRQLSVGNKVIIGTTPVIQPLISAYFPDHEQAELPSYNISYSRRLPQWMGIALKLPGLFRTIRREKKRVAELV